jgi:hypothetical protein
MNVLIACEFSGIVREEKIHKIAPQPEGGKNRSKTDKGIVEAMAVQWG